MLFKKIATVAAFFFTANNAFLLMPSHQESGLDTIKALPFGIQEEVVELKCTGCPIPAGTYLNGLPVNLQHVTSTLELNFTVEEHAGADRLLLNNVPIYPPNMASIEPFKARQVFKKDQPFESRDNVALGYEMSLMPVQKDNAQLELIDIDIHIFEVADKFIHGIDIVALQLIKTPSGKLMLTKLSTASSTVGFPDGDGKDCTSMLCKWRAIVAAKLAHLKPFKGCGKGKGNKSGVAISGHKGKSHGGSPHYSQGKHSMHEGHRHHRNHSTFARVVRMLRSISIHVLIPIFIGVVAGITAAVLGMLIGQLVILVCRTIRGNPPAYSRVQDDFVDEEKMLIIQAIEEAHGEKAESDA